MLSDAAAIRAVVLEGRVRSHLSGRTLIQMGTIAPGESEALGREGKA
jgi:3-hydroxyisobutyrate dehydrogenase-like beta-hydroxyacid dehydrogenase